MYELFYRKIESPSTARTEPVVLASVLSHPVNANIGVRAHALVDTINGIRIDKLEDVPKAFESNNGKAQHLLKFQPLDTIEAIDKSAADEASSEILKTYGVPKDRRL